MINTVLLAIITGMLIGKWIFEPLLQIWLEYKNKASFEMMWDKFKSGE